MCDGIGSDLIYTIMNDAAVTEYGKRFEEQRSRVEAFTEKVQCLLKELVQNREFSARCRITGRTKTSERFEHKLHRKGDKYADPLSEVTELSGIRIVVDCAEDIDLVLELLRQTFEIDWPNSVDKGLLLKSEPIRLSLCPLGPGAQRRSTQNARVESLQRHEVRVSGPYCAARRVGKHRARLVYRTADEAPEELRRSLSRLSALSS